MVKGCFISHKIQGFWGKLETEHLSDFTVLEIYLFQIILAENRNFRLFKVFYLLAQG